MHAARRDDARNNRDSLNGALSSPDGKERYVRRLFHTIAGRYDLITVLLSFGRDAAWKRRLVRLAADTEPLAHGPAATTTGDRPSVLDLACGTGDITYAFAARGARIVGLDVTPRMIALAAAKTPPTGSRPFFLIGDMMALPFPDRSFDLVTTGYGLRNVPLLETALREIARVLRPGGRLLSLDFNRPDNAFIRGIYLGYLHAVGGALGWALHGDADTYRYIPATIRLYPGAERLAAMMRQHGFSSATWIPVLGGLMAIHDARAPR